LNLDRQIFALFNERLHDTLLDAILPRITNAHKAVWFWVIMTPLLVWWWRKGGQLGRTVLVLLAVLLPTVNFVSSGIVKPLFHRPRPTARIIVGGEAEYVVAGARLPPHTEPLGTSSFPSSHSAVTSALASTLILAYRRRKRLVWLALAIPLIIGWSRIYVGVHYPTDVLAGWILGALLAWGAWTAVVKWQPQLGADQDNDIADDMTRAQPAAR
jgi:membrane-associated phospholipid phosphatase